MHLAHDLGIDWHLPKKDFGSQGRRDVAFVKLWKMGNA